MTESPLDLQQAKTNDGLTLAKMAREIHPVLNIWYNDALKMHILGFRGIISHDDFASIAAYPIDISTDDCFTEEMKSYLTPSLLTRMSEIREILMAGLDILLYGNIGKYPKSMKVSSFMRDDGIAILISSSVFASYYGIAFDSSIPCDDATGFTRATEFTRQSFIGWATNIINKRRVVAEKQQERIQYIIDRVGNMNAADWSKFLEKRKSFVHQLARQLKLEE